MFTFSLGSDSAKTAYSGSTESHFNRHPTTPESLQCQSKSATIQKSI